MGNVKLFRKMFQRRRINKSSLSNYSTNVQLGLSTCSQLQAFSSIVLSSLTTEVHYSGDFLRPHNTLMDPHSPFAFVVTVKHLKCLKSLLAVFFSYAWNNILLTRVFTLEAECQIQPHCPHLSWWERFSK